MNSLAKRILSILLVICLLTSGAGDLTAFGLTEAEMRGPAGELYAPALTGGSAPGSLTKTLDYLEGSWAYWTVRVNPTSDELNGGGSMVLSDTFFEDGTGIAGQSIDYASITVTGEGVTYDYRGYTGTFVIPDSTAVTVSYRTRIAARPGENATFLYSSRLLGAGDLAIGTVSGSETAVIYPSASDVADTSGIYMVKLFVYADGQMQTGLPGARFILLDANQRPMIFRKGERAGQPVTFVTGDDGYADVRLDAEPGEVSIRKNTGYYLEMIQAPTGYQKDNTLYSFMITDDPSYNSGGVWTYYNGDTTKVRLYPEAPGLKVSLRFSGNVSLTDAQKNAVEVSLQKKDGEGWTEVERHSYAEFSYGSLTFRNGSGDQLLEDGATYRVVQENQRPWELDGTVLLKTAHYLIIGSGEALQGETPLEFSVTTENQSSSFNVIVSNEYEEPRLTITTMDTETGETLSGAMYVVKKAGDGAAVATHVTGADGTVVISGGAAYESETLYYAEETAAPAGYLLPLEPERIYFYFCNDEFFIEQILMQLPAGATAVNLSETYDAVTVDNQKEKLTVPVMKLWQGNAWPANVQSVAVGLYQSVGGAEPEPVMENGEARTVALTGLAPYNNSAFTGLPARDGENRPIVYSIREEKVTAQTGENILDRYVREYGISDAGVYIVRNKEATTLTVTKVWCDPNGDPISDEAVLSQQSSVTFDVYRTTQRLSDAVLAGGVENGEMESLFSGMTRVRSGLSFGAGDGWTLTLSDLDKYADSREPYYYYVRETVPSFGNEVCFPAEAAEPDYAAHAVTIRNPVAPERVSVTVKKAPLVDDPRPEAVNTEFTFTLLLKNGDHVIRSYTVFDDGNTRLTTDWNGEASFALKPSQSITLSLPKGVTATVTEALNPEYVAAAAAGGGVTDLEPESGRVFRFAVNDGAAGETVTFTNTLRVICKVLDVDGETEKPFESLKSALAYIREHADHYQGAATVWMMEDYVMPTTDVFDVRAGESIILTTAATDSAQFPFHTDRTENTDAAVITRGGVGGSMLTNDGVLTLDKVILDGGAIETDCDGGIVHSTGTLILGADTTLRNAGTTGKGGAIWSGGTLHMQGGSLTGNTAADGSAIYLESGTLNMTGGRIEHNTVAGDGGAVTVRDPEARINLSGSPVIFNNRNEADEWADLLLGVNVDNVLNVRAPGLGAEAKIGVLPVDGHREIGEQFAIAEYGLTANLDAFVNDLYEYRGKVKDGTATNVVWDGLTLTIGKTVAPEGAKAGEGFTVTLTSASIRRNIYTIDGTVDFTVTAARPNTPGTIVLRNVKAGDVITISPLPVGVYTVSEAASSYAPSFAGTNMERVTSIAIGEDGSFSLEGDSTVTLTNTRRLAEVRLTKTLQDRLKLEAETQDFSFAVKLTEADGTPVKGFSLAAGLVTDNAGEATFTVSPSNTASVVKTLRAPVGAVMTIAETADPNYRVAVSALTRPAKGEGAIIPDADAADNVFAFTVTDDGASIRFDNLRNLAEIELRKELTGKVSAEEDFTITVTLYRRDGTPAAGYTMLLDAEHPEYSIVTDANGQAVIPFRFGRGETAKAVALTIPEGARLEAAETIVTKEVNGGPQPIYNTAVSINGGAAATGTSAVIPSVADSDHSIVFTNARKTHTVTVTNTVGGYSGNTLPFAFTAAVTDGGEDQDDYDDDGFTDGVQHFSLATGQSRTLTVPYGATLKIAEDFVIGYETTVKRGSSAAVTAMEAEFVVTANETLAFTNNQLIGLRLVNNTSSTLENVRVYTAYGTRMYRVNEAGTGQDPVTVTDHWATVSIAPGKTAVLEINHQNSVTYEQAYTVKGFGPAEGYHYTLRNEPSFHEFADPAILRIYDAAAFEVKGKLRYSVSDSTVTFTEQPLVSFDVNGGVWTTEMDGYRDRDGDRLVYQMAVDQGETVSGPTPDPVYPTAEGVGFLGWTADEAFAKASHTAGEDISANAYDFSAPVTAPLTLWAVWAKPARDWQVVTVRNGLGDSLTVTATLTSGGSPIEGHALSGGLFTDAAGQASIPLSPGESRNLTVPKGAELAFAAGSDALAVSSEFADGDASDGGFGIASVDRDGTVSFAAGVCKITDSAGNILYNASGRPAVYTTLAAAFTAYNGTLYTTAGHSTPAVQAAVKLLVDEYTVSAKHAFPTKNVVLTTAGKGDADFPYMGVRDRATIVRAAGFAADTLFTHQASATAVTLTNVILDGGSVSVNKGANGSLIYMNRAGAVLNIDAGSTLRNVQYNDYSDGNNSRGGAIYLQGGTVNVSAGLFSNLHARRGGAIAVTGGTLNVTGANGSTRFENCRSDGDDGGAIAYTSDSDFSVDGGTDKNKPGIIFTACQALGENSDGGAIYVDKKMDVSVSGCAFTECSAKNTKGNNASGYGGGAIAARNIKGLSVSHCSFNACDTLKCGGAIMVYLETKYGEGGKKALSISDCAFAHCACKGQGGAVAAYQDNNGATTSTTEIYIVNTSFENCNSGTDNGSGGAIQTYVPCMHFENTDFTDCWAGKEGGAVNNYFGDNYTAVWNNSSLTLTNCHFIRCRAEDRYDPTALQHYGGGINTKAKTVTVTGSTFEDCVSTLKEGGALHLGGQGGGSKATITGSTFKNCTAKNGGGALLSSHETLEIEGCYFYGCSSSASNGGAVYHYRNSRGDSTQKNTTIKSSTFSIDPDDDEGVGCSAAQNGGAIWTRGHTVTISGCTIEGCAAGRSGGAVFLSADGKTAATFMGGALTGNKAASGSAVYVENRTATFSGVAVTGNTCSDVNSGAIHGGTLYFEGNVKVQDNVCSEDDLYDHDVLLQNDNAATIHTTETGLGAEANVGVYVTTDRFNKRGTEGKVFGTHGGGAGDACLDSFFNDRDDQLFGYKATAGETSIYWGIVVCKITDAEGNTLKRENGKDAVYQRLTLALDDFTRVTGGQPVYIKMLVEDYNVFQNAQISNFPAANVTLTTAGSDDAAYPYRGTPGTVCTVSRTNSTKQLFYLNNANATFRLENITLDGRRDKTAAQGEFRLIEANNGKVVVNGGTTFRYGYDNLNGGAIKINNGSNAGLEIHSSAGKDVLFDHCVQNNNNGGGNTGGGAIHSAKSVTIDSTDGGKTIFTDCNGKRGGAIMLAGNSADLHLSVDGAEFVNCYCAASEGGAIYHNNNNNTTASTVIRNSTFDTCCTIGDGQRCYGGAVNAKTAYLTVEGCSFRNCWAESNGGAINHGSGNADRIKTVISNTVFDGCRTTGSNNNYGYGGCVYTQAKTIEITGSEFLNSTSYNYGGALYCDSTSGSNAVIAGSAFDNCSVTRTGGCGGAICSRRGTLTLQDQDGAATTINACAAPGFSGAVYMETAGSTLNITGSARISSCYANLGGAIYLNNGVTMNLSGSPEFTRNGYSASGGTLRESEAGACIYLAEGGGLNLSGSPKFSRNILPNQTRITNGGILDYVRQDVYLAGYSGRNATSIHIAGELTGDTVWIWPAEAPHKGPNDQFATTEASVSAASLDKLRNALADGVTGCTDGEYLAGIRLYTGNNNVYWDKMYNISFRKIDNKAVGVPGAEFTLYTDRECTRPFAQKTSADGLTDVDAQGVTLRKGVVDFTAVHIGVYYMKETVTPESFIGSDTTYIVLVGTPYLAPNVNNLEYWNNGGPLDVENAATLVARHTTNAGLYYGIFPLGSDGKADVSKNLAGSSVGITNIRRDYEAWFMKTDDLGAPLPNAAFTLYSPVLDSMGNPVFSNGHPAMTLWSRDGENYPEPVRSADGTPAYRKLNGETVPKGLVYFRELPIGTYYLVETAYPERNGSNRRTFFVEDGTVFRLEVLGTSGFALSVWENGAFTECGRSGDNYVVRNLEAVCKLTDGSGSLLYELGADGETLHPAIYATLEAGFAAAQEHTLYNRDKTETDSGAALMLMALKDLALSPVTYSGERPLTLTTAARTATAADRYVFITTRTADTSRAEIRRSGGSEDSPLITVSGNAHLTLRNIHFNGQKSGQGIHVTQGSLAVQENTLLQNWKTGASEPGGAVRLESGAGLTIDGGTGRTAIFADNETESGGGAISLGPGCSVSIANARFTGNSAAVSGGALCLEAPDGVLTIRNAIFTANTAEIKGGAIFAGEHSSLSLSGSTLSGNAAADGGAIFAGEGGSLTISSGTLGSNRASSGSGGAVCAASGASVTLTGGVIQRNRAAADGGAISAASGASVTLTGGTLKDNTAAGNGGAIFVGGSAEVAVSGGVLTGNSAVEGSAVYAGDQAEVRLSGGVVTGNRASGAGGGAINAGGSQTRFCFSGDPVVFDNFSGAGDGQQQRNVVLGADSNEIIHAGATGLGAGALIGVYVTGEIGGDPFTKHGLPGKPFGTEDPAADPADPTERNLQVFRNDRNLALCGVTGEGGTIRWNPVVCKLTTVGDKLLYQRLSFTVNGSVVTRSAPAIYSTLQGGFDAARGTIYNGNSTFTAEDIQLKLLTDVALESGISYSGTRRVTLTTAETTAPGGEDYFVFAAPRSDAEGKALLSRAFTGDSMIRSDGGRLTLTNVTLDGGKAEGCKAESDGGLVRVGGGSALVIAAGAALQNSLTTQRGGAVYAAAGGSVTVTGGSVSRNESEGDGAGIYLDGAAIYLSGNPDFGGKGTDADGRIITPAEDPNAGGNWKRGSVPDGELNGTQAYTRYRQDIFVTGFTGSPASSVTLTGNLGYDPDTGAFDPDRAGSVWVWCDDNDPSHHRDKEQFAVVMSGADVSTDSYTVFRNARNDAETANAANEYLKGTAGDSLGGRVCVYWGPSVVGSRKVILRKASDDYLPLRGARFTVYSGSTIVRVGSEVLEDLESLESGIIWIGVLPYGTYYLKETTAPEGHESSENSWFCLIVDESGAYMSGGFKNADEGLAKKSAYEAAAALKHG